jgi:hypothetical protein
MVLQLFWINKFGTIIKGTIAGFIQKVEYNNIREEFLKYK